MIGEQYSNMGQTFNREKALVVRRSLLTKYLKIMLDLGSALKQYCQYAD